MATGPGGYLNLPRAHPLETAEAGRMSLLRPERACFGSVFRWPPRHPTTAGFMLLYRIRPPAESVASGVPMTEGQPGPMSIAAPPGATEVVQMERTSPGGRPGTISPLRSTLEMTLLFMRAA